MTSEEQADSSYQPALSRWDLAWRYALVVVISFYASASYQYGMLRNWVIIDLSVGVIALILSLFRRRWPTTIALVTNLAGVVSFSAFGPSALATVSVSTRRRWRQIVPVAVVFLAVTVAQSWLPRWDYEGVGEWPEATVLEMVLGFSSMFVLLGMQIGWGLYIGSRRHWEWTLHRRADRLEREQEMRAQLARDAERAQIAREMHDVLAHRISQVSMQAGAIAYRGDLDADALRRAAADLQASANAALVDLRGVLGVLRDPESGAALDVPQPRFSDIDTLISHAQSTGLRIDSVIDVDSDVDDTIGRTLYRVTQECITNARKHAPNATVTIRISGSPADGIVLRSSNPLPVGRRSLAVPTSGYGLIGLAERAALVGGKLTTHRSVEEFSIVCRVPWQPDTEAVLPDDVGSANR